ANLWLEVMFPITWGGVWEYPYVEAQVLIRDARDTFGASKLIWGSDMPNVERFCTYRQCVDYVRRHCNFLTAPEKDQVLGGNLARIVGVGEGRRAGVAGGSRSSRGWSRVELHSRRDARPDRLLSPPQGRPPPPHRRRPLSGRHTSGWHGAPRGDS